MPTGTTEGSDPATGCASDQALAHLDEFCQRILPGALRRVASWKGIRLRRQQDLLADLRQELVLDCLEHPDQVCGLDRRDRHGRWFRVVERSLYRLQVRDARVAEGDAGLELVPERRTGDHVTDGLLADTLLPELQQPDRWLLRQLLQGGDQFGNGRCNLSATADRLGVHVRRVRELWEQMAERLGFGRQFLAFWRRRLAEAALGLAADLLRDTGALHIHGDHERGLPDPAGRHRRIRRIRSTVRVRPLPRELTHWLRTLSRPHRDLATVQELLDGAEALAPSNAAVPLWRFEACILAGDLAGAARSVRRARRMRAPAVPVVLARARLLEARGRDAIAARLLSRALQRHRGDGRILTALRGLESAAPGQDHSSARSSASASWPSHSGSPRTAVQR